MRIPKFNSGSKPTYRGQFSTPAWPAASGRTTSSSRRNSPRRRTK